MIFMKTALTIAGSDSCGGAGIQADLKSFSAQGVYGMSVITAVTAQNTQGVFAVQDLTPEIIGQQIDAIFTDIEVDAVKIGMVSQIASIETISKKLQQYSPKNVVIDPVMISKSGYSLLQPEAKTALIEKLIPLADVLTPNLPEAEAILEEKYQKEFKITNVDEMVLAAKEIHKLGPKYVLIKGGHLEGKAVDVLYDGTDMTFLETERINTKNTHGTGCTLSSAIAANLALGFSIVESVKRAKEYITIAIEQSLEIGKGVGPTNHFYTLYKKAGLNYE
jgi:hydroxymethylpyrimidine/phosphomethylpyrimidine kinase